MLKVPSDVPRSSQQWMGTSSNWLGTFTEKLQLIFHLMVKNKFFSHKIMMKEKVFTVTTHIKHLTVWYLLSAIMQVKEKI